jgi:hypothetical protein
MFHFRRKAFHHQGAKTQRILGALVVDSKRTNSSFTRITSLSGGVSIAYSRNFLFLA